MTNASTVQTMTDSRFEGNTTITPQKPAPSACCGGAAPAGTDACCARDAEILSTGGPGCGCKSSLAEAGPKATACCSNS